jgi:hypothetical protein
MSALSDAATAPIPLGGPPGRRSWRGWRRSRPFWAGCWTAAAAALLLAVPYSVLRVGDLTVALSTIGGSSALLIAIVLVACTYALWFRPDSRVVAGVIIIVVSVVALAVTNLGAFGLGTTLGIVGGSLAVAWTPGRDEGTPAEGDIPPRAR